jgi:hypothetical protein
MAAEAAAYQMSAQLMSFMEKTLKVVNNDLRRMFITVPSASMYYLNPKHFKQNPWLMDVATHYYGFHGFDAVNPRSSLLNAKNKTK